MKLKILIASLLVGAGLTAQADDNRQLIDSVPTKRVTLPKNPKPWIPHSPSLVVMDCYYGKGFIQLSIPEGCYYVTIHLYNELYEWKGMVTNDQPRTELPEDLKGRFTIICRTDDNQVFSGTLEF